MLSLLGINLTTCRVQGFDYIFLVPVVFANAFGTVQLSHPANSSGYRQRDKQVSRPKCWRLNYSEILYN